MLSIGPPMLNKGQIRRCRGLDKVGRHVTAMHNPLKSFLIDCVSKNGSFVSERDLAMPKKNNFLLLLSKLSTGRSRLGRLN